MKTPIKHAHTSSPTALTDRELAAATGAGAADKVAVVIALAGEAYDAARGFAKGFVKGFTGSEK